MKRGWHQLLCFLKIRDDLDYTPPFAFEVPHRYFQDADHKCCAYCGDGKRHSIHDEPWSEKRMKEILAVEAAAGQAKDWVPLPPR